MLSYEEFCEELKDEVLGKMEDAGRKGTAEVRCLRDGENVMILKGFDKRFEPGMKLSSCYRDYQKGYSVQKIVSDYWKTIEERMKLPIMESDLSLESVKDKLFIKLINAARNKEKLKKIEHRIVEEFAVTYHILAEDNEKGITSIPVTKEVLMMLGISFEELEKIAMRSAVDLFPAQVLPYFDWEAEDDSEQVLFLVLTNSRFMNGAASMFYPRLLDLFLERYNDDLLVIPSSIHEVIIIAAHVFENPEDAEKMLEKGNLTTISREEVLADHVYLYTADERKLRRAVKDRQETGILRS